MLESSWRTTMICNGSPTSLVYETSPPTPDVSSILEHHELGEMFGLDDVDAIAAEPRRRGVSYHVSAGSTQIRRTCGRRSHFIDRSSYPCLS